MMTYQGHVRLATGQTVLMEVVAPNNFTALQMLRAMGECASCAEK